MLIFPSSVEELPLCAFTSRTGTSGRSLISVHGFRGALRNLFSNPIRNTWNWGGLIGLGCLVCLVFVGFDFGFGFIVLFVGGFFWYLLVWFGWLGFGFNFVHYLWSTLPSSSTYWMNPDTVLFMLVFISSGSLYWNWTEFLCYSRGNSQTMELLLHCVLGSWKCICCIFLAQIFFHPPKKFKAFYCQIIRINIC